MLQVITKSLLEILYPASCLGCGKDETWLCSRCLSEPSPLILPHPIQGVDLLLSLGSYDSPILERTVKLIKYHGGKVLAQPLGKALAKNFRKQIKQSAVIPVPLHPKRLNMRGFNQALVLARAVAHASRSSVLELVIRTKNTIPQVELTGKERMANVREAFSLNPKIAEIPKSGIVIDDVFTTGATISEVAEVLRRAGMKHIIALTIAKG